MNSINNDLGSFRDPLENKIKYNNITFKILKN